jgi:hypothetical protein
MGYPDYRRLIFSSGGSPSTLISLNYRTYRALLFCPEKPGPLGQVKDRWLCLGFLCLKDERPTSKGEHCGNY